MIEIASPRVAASQQAYRWLLGSTVGDELAVENGLLRFRADTSSTHRVHFGVADYAAAKRLLLRRAMKLVESRPGEAAAEDEPAIGVVADVLDAHRPDESDITAIDHLVFHAPDRDAAVALFAGTLGFDFRLQQSVFDDAMQLFFRSPAVVVEVLVRAASDAMVDRVGLWGIAWRSNDIEKTHHRLEHDGVPVTPVRDGRKPGTRVFTVKDPELVVPTLVIG